MDTLRGAHSTGIFVVEHANKVDEAPDWFKSLDNGHDFVDTKEYSEIMDTSSEYSFVVAHNRFATMGGITADSAHPFQEGAITMVHNGTLDNTYCLPTPMHQLDGVQVDSHAICHNLNLHPYKEVIESLEGAFTLIWHDARDNCLRIVRNSKRPLNMARVMGEDTIVFGSEEGMVTWIAERNHISLLDMIEPDAGTLLTINLGDAMNATEEKLTLAKPHVFYGSGLGGKYSSGYSWDSKPATVITPYTPPESTWKDSKNEVMVGGRMRPIPTGAQEALCDLDLLVEDTLRFTPTSIMPTKSGRGKVTGVLTSTGQAACIYNASAELFQMYKGGSWAVKPITVNHLDVDGASRCLVVLKVVSYLFNSKYHSEPAYKSTPVPMVAEYVDSGWEGYDRGDDELQAIVAAGCIQCGGVVDADDFDECQLVNNSRDALCYSCVCEMKFGGIE